MTDIKIIAIEERKDGSALVNSLILKHNLAKAKIRRKKFNELIENILIEQIQKSKEKLLSDLENMFPSASDSPAFNAYFHKLKSADKEDLQDLINDAKILQLLNQELEKEQPNDDE